MTPPSHQEKSKTRATSHHLRQIPSMYAFISISKLLLPDYQGSSVCSWHRLRRWGEKGERGHLAHRQGTGRPLHPCLAPATDKPVSWAWLATLSAQPAPLPGSRN